MKLFADTSYWVALVRGGDENRPAAIRWQKRILNESIPLVTTEGVLWETLNSLSTVRHRGHAIRLYRQAHQSPNIHVVGFEPELCAQAIKLYAERDDKTWSVVDCLSFLAMQHHGIVKALTSDQHFEQAGFTPLLRSTSEGDFNL